jgi:hypothetical protein
MMTSITFEYRLRLTADINNQDVRKALCLDNNSILSPWYTALANVFGEITNSYDGYIHNVDLNIVDSIPYLNITCYIVIDNSSKVISYKNRYGSQWQNELETLVSQCVFNHARTLHQKITPVSIISV